MNTPISLYKHSIQNPIIKKQLQCTVLDYRGSDKPEPETKTLVLLVERSAGSTETFRIQLTHDMDLSFIYRDEITLSKFQVLSSEWRLSRELRDDMKEFFQGSLRELINDSQLEAKVMIYKEGKTCLLELETQEKRSTLKITVELKIVAGDDLMRYLMDAVMNLRRKLRKLEDELIDKKKIKDEKSQLEEEVSHLRTQISQMDNELKRKTRELDSRERELSDVKNDLQLKEEEVDDCKAEHEEEITDLLKHLEQLKNEKADIEDQMNHQQDEYLGKIERKNLEINDLNGKLRKYDEITRKYHSTPPVSISDGKVKELEEANKEKDETITALQTKIHELMKTNSEQTKRIQQIQGEMEKCKKYLASPTHLYNQRGMMSPLYGSPVIGYSNSSPFRPQSVVLPPPVGMPLHNANRLPIKSSLTTSKNVAVSKTPIVPVSECLTPILDQEKKRREARAAGKENASPIEK